MALPRTGASGGLVRSIARPETGRADVREWPPHHRHENMFCNSRPCRRFGNSPRTAGKGAQRSNSLILRSLAGCGRVVRAQKMRNNRSLSLWSVGLYRPILVTDPVAGSRGTSARSLLWQVIVTHRRRHPGLLQGTDPGMAVPMTASRTTGMESILRQQRTGGSL